MEASRMEASRMEASQMEASLSQALTWSRERQFLAAGARSVADVVGRLCAVPAWLGDAEMAVRRRPATPSSDALTDAVDRGELIRTYAFRGSTHLLPAADAGGYLAVRCTNRQWELRSWQEHYGLSPQDWPALREVVREVVAQGPVRQSELAAQVAQKARFRHLRTALVDKSHTLLKPLAWQGDLCFGPAQGGEHTFRSPSWSPRWTGLPDLDDAGRAVVLAYLGAYGPATRDNLHYWLVAGLSAGRRRVDGWIAELTGDRPAEIQVDGVVMLHLRENLAPLAATEPDPDAVILLPGHDQWVLGPGTADARIVPAAHRPLVTRGANMAIRDGRVAGTWKIHGEALAVSWFAGSPPRAQLAVEVARLSGLLDRPLTVEISS
jgi:hypothetical protein